MSKYRWKDIAILVRTKAQIGPIERELAWNNVPYRLVGGMSFFDQREVRDIIALLSWIVNPLSLMDVSRFAKNMVNGLGEKAFNPLYQGMCEVYTTHQDLLDALTAKPKSNDKYVAMHSLLNTAVHINKNYMDSVYDALCYADTTLGIVETLRKEDKANVGSKDTNREESWNVLIQMISKKTSINKFLDDAVLTSAADQPDDDNCITISTIHAAKGREWPVVMVPGVNDSSLPHVMGQNSADEIEQEFNAYYVAKTRPEEHLIITRAITSSSYGGPPQRNKRSRFIEKNMHIFKTIGKTKLL